VDFKSPSEGGTFHTMAARKMYEMPELVVMLTDTPSRVPGLKTVEMSPAADVKLTVKHRSKYFSQSQSQLDSV
jgi:hypothetical protein